MTILKNSEAGKMLTQTNHDENKQLFTQIQVQPTKMPDVLRLRAAGLTYLEIAAELGLSRNNVAQYLYRAKKMYQQPAMSK